MPQQIRIILFLAGLILLVVAAAMVAAPLGVAVAGAAAIFLAVDARPTGR